MADLLDAFGDKLEDLGLPRAPDTGAAYNELTVVPPEWAPVCKELFSMVRLARKHRAFPSARSCVVTRIFIAMFCDLTRAHVYRFQVLRMKLLPVQLQHCQERAQLQMCWPSRLHSVRPHFQALNWA